MIGKAKLLLALFLAHCAVCYSQTASTVTVAWDASAGQVTGYFVYAKNTATSQTVKTDAGNTTSAAINSLVAGQTYSIYVTAYDASKVESVPSNAINYTVPSGPTAPSSVALTALGSQSIKASWVDNSSNEGGFSIWRKTDTGSFTQIASVGANVTTYTDNTVQPGPQYSYQIGSFNSSGSSLSPASAVARTGPYAPSGLAVTATSSTQTRVTWRDNSTNETGFRVFRRVSGGTYSAIADTAANTTAWADGTVTGGTTYFYTVSALGSPFASAASGEVSVFVPGTMAGPTSLSATPLTSSQVSLSWTDNSTQESGFRIMRRTDSSSYAQIATVGTNVTTFRDSTATPGVHYYYEVGAYDSAGNSSPISNEATAYTGPLPPTGLAAVPRNPSGITFTWKDNSSDETGFRVFRSPSGASWTALSVTSSNVTQYIDSNVTGGTRYYYTVSALGSPFDSAATNSVSVVAPTTTNGTPAPTAATFVGFDASTSGNWVGIYGASGNWIEGTSSSIPSYLTVAAKNASIWTWVNNTTVPTAPLRPDSSGTRIAACWYSPTSFSFNLNIADGQTHRISAYILDWDKQNRQERVEILDTITGSLLNSQTISNFSTGLYATWDLSGKVTIRVTRLTGPDGVISGLFF